MIKSFKLVQTS